MSPFLRLLKTAALMLFVFEPAEASVFTGLGTTCDEVPIVNNPDVIYKDGLGAKVHLLTTYNLWVGPDIARGPEDWNDHIRIGHP